MTDTQHIRIEVAFATQKRQCLVELAVAKGATVANAIRQSGIAAQFPDDDLDTLAVGVWGRPVDAQQLLEDGDRVEIYRPLLIDPREARMRLAAEGRSMGGVDAGDNDDESGL